MTPTSGEAGGHTYRVLSSGLHQPFPPPWQRNVYAFACTGPVLLNSVSPTPVTPISTRLWELYIPLPPPRANTICDEGSGHLQLTGQWSSGWESVPSLHESMSPSLTDQFGAPRWGSQKLINGFKANFTDSSHSLCTPSDETPSGRDF